MTRQREKLKIRERKDIKFGTRSREWAEGRGGTEVSGQMNGLAEEKSKMILRPEEGAAMNEDVHKAQLKGECVHRLASIFPLSKGWGALPQ